MPLLDEKEPEGQGLQNELPLEFVNLPASHKLQTSLLTVADADPGAQGMQAERPVTGAYSPALQGVQT